MIVESYYWTTHGTRRSAGLAEMPTSEYLAFLQSTADQYPPLVVQSVVQERDLVIIHRGSPLSGVRTHRDECLFPHEEAALDFAEAVRTVMSAPRTLYYGYL